MTITTVYTSPTQAAKTLALVILIVLVGGFFTWHFTKNLPTPFAVGCDSYGYLKQKQLFTESGWIKGLQTTVRDREARFLISIASKINVNPLTWAEMIAPHCHHYDKTTEQIVLQYPPGTGGFLSLLPMGKETQALTILMVLSTVFLYVISNILTFGFRYFLFSTSTFYVALAAIVKFQVPSYSIPVTMLLIPWVVIFLFFSNSNSNIKNYFNATLLGLVCGFLVDVRIASLLILPGVFFIFFIDFTKTQQYKKLINWTVPVVGLIFFGFSIAPLLHANHINVGGAFNSTYAVYDTEIKFDNLDLILSNIKFYLTDNAAAVIAVLTITYLLLNLIFSNSKYLLKENINPIILILLFVSNLIFYCLKPVAIDYYFLPVSIFCLYFGLLDFAKLHNNSTKPGHHKIKFCSAVLCFTFLLGFFSYKIQITTPTNIEVKIPDPLLEKEPIVYAGITGGIVNYYFGKYTAKLDFGGLCMAEQLLTRVALSGKTQYIINDTPKMQELLQGVGLNKFEKIGVLTDPIASYDIYKFSDAKPELYPLISCDLTVNRQFASSINLYFSGKVDGDTYIGTVTINNNSDISFSTRPISGNVKISWRFINTNDLNNPPPWIARKELFMMIAAKNSYDIDFLAPLPKEKGTYLMELTLVQEGFSWFHEYGMEIPTQIVIVD